MAPKRKLGGIRIRLGLATKARLSTGGADMEGFLGKMYCKGKLSSLEVADGARASGSLLAGGERLRRWARVAKSATTRKNAARDLRREFNTHTDVPLVYEAEGVFWNRRLLEQYKAKVKFVLPFEVMMQFGSGFDVSEYNALSDTQEGLRNDLAEWCQNLSITDRGDIAVASLWGDAAPYHSRGRDQVILFAWNIISGIWHRRYWLCAMGARQACKCGCSGRCSFAIIWDVLAWVGRVCMTGVYPSCRHDGTPFSESTFANDKRRAGLGGKPLPFKLAFLRARGDWSWYKQALSLQGWANASINSRTCWICKATRRNMSEFSLTASWRATRLTHREYITEVYEQGRHLSGLFKLPAFQLKYVLIDLMHTGDLGVILDCIGNVFYENFRSSGGTAQRHAEPCSRILYLIKVVAHELQMPAPINDLTIGMLRLRGGPPRLKVKAAEARDLLKICLKMLQMFFPPNSEHDQTRFRCVETLYWFYMELDAWDPATSPDRIASLARRHCLLYAQLSFEQAPGSKTWRIFPKHHLFVHLAELATNNPRDDWAYADEAAIGVASTLAESVHPTHLQRMLVVRWRVSCRIKQG